MVNNFREMLQRITDLWPALLRGINPDGDEDEERILGGQGQGEDGGGEIDVDEQQVLEDYRTLNWSRLVCVAEQEAEEAKMWPLGPDVVEECRAVAALPAVDPDGWSPLFEPVEFNDAHGPLQADDYRLT